MYIYLYIAEGTFVCLKCYILDNKIYREKEKKSLHSIMKIKLPVNLLFKKKNG